MKWSETVLRELHRLAELGNLSAQCQLGDFYSTGGSPAHKAVALEWYQRAAEGGFYRAQLLLADLYANGDGVENDGGRAAHWYLRAADQGSARALLALIRMAPIEASARVSDRAFAKSTQAAEDGDPEAQCWLGLAYEHGIRVTRDPSLAAQLYYLAAKRGHYQARVLLEPLTANDSTAAKLAAALDKAAREREADLIRERQEREPQQDAPKPETRESGTAPMTGTEFELLVKDLLRKNGYDDVQITPGSRDMGADLVVRHNGSTIVVQCKRYSGAVGLQAVQEVLGAKAFYQANAAWVITDSTFTQAAETLARAGGVRLVDGDTLRGGNL